MVAQYFQKHPSAVSEGHVNGLPPCKIVAPPLDKANFPKVKFWTKRLFKKACRETIGDTNALATSRKKRGRPRRRDNDDTDDETSDERRHNYIEDVNGNPVTDERLWQISAKARKIWQSLQKANLAPSTWLKIDNDAYEYFKSEMLNEFTEFQLCEGSWKLDRWATLNYSSWTNNHLRVKTESSAKKAKLEADQPATPNIDPLDNANLIAMDENFNNNPLDDSTHLSEPPDVAIVGRPKPKPVWVRQPSSQLFHAS